MRLDLDESGNIWKDFLKFYCFGYNDYCTIGTNTNPQHQYEESLTLRGKSSNAQLRLPSAQRKSKLFVRFWCIGGRIYRQTERNVGKVLLCVCVCMYACMCSDA